MANGSFYQNGLPISSEETGLGNVNPGAPVPNAASSSFYLSGTVYQTLENQDALLALLLADTDLVAADLVAANLAAANAAASASAAAATLASAMLKANNLSDVASVSQAKLNLSLVKADVGLGNVDNTSDVNKPVSTAQAAADALVASNAAAATALKANIASPALTGTPSAPTAAALNNSTQLATTAYADGAVSTLSGTVNTALALKAPLASPALTGTPTAPTAAPGTNTTQLASTAFATAADAVVTTAYIAADAVVTSAYIAADALKAPLASPALTGTPTAPTAAGGTNTTQLATTAFVASAVAAAGVSSIAGNTGAFTLGDGLTNATNILKVDPSFLRGYLSGLTLSTAGSSATFGVAIGVAVDSTAASTGFMKLASAYTKTTSAWALGTAAGSLDTGTIAINTWYHVHLIKRPDTGVVDVLVSLSATAPTLPTNYTLFRRIGSMKTNGSSQWIKFVQLGDEFLWDTVVNDIAAAATAATATLHTLSTPLGIQTNAIFSARLDWTSGGGSVLYFTSPDQADIATGSAITMLIATSTVPFMAMGNMSLRTNTSSQIRARGNGTVAVYNIVTAGWIDTRGKLS